MDTNFFCNFAAPNVYIHSDTCAHIHSNTYDDLYPICHSIKNSHQFAYCHSHAQTNPGKLYRPAKLDT